MAKTTRTPPRVSPIRESDATSDSVSEATTALLEPPDDGEPATPFDEAPPTASAPPPKRKTPKSITFFDRVADIALADWGTRAKIKVYRLAPIINRLVGSENKYVTIYREPLTEEKLKVDHGSGRYRLYLNFKGAGEKGDKELDMVEIDILDPKFPPNIPAGEWVEDPRNKEWQWARQPGMPAAPLPVAPVPQPATGVSELVSVLKVAGDMRRELRDEMQPAAAPTAAPAPVAPTVDPVAQGLHIAKEFMLMRSENPMVDVLRDELKAMREELKEERAEGRRLQEEIRKGQTVQQTAAAPKSLVDQVKELATIRTELKALFGGGEEAAAAVRPGKFGWLDFASEVLPKVMDSPILTSLANRIAAGTPGPQMNPSAPPSATPGLDDTMKFVQSVVTPAMLEYFRVGEEGSTFAAWIHDGYPGRVAELQSFGEQRIFELYKNHAPRSDWQLLTVRGEAEFAKFIHEFCTWKPEPDEDEPEKSSPVAASVIIDLDADEDKGAES